MNFTNTDCVENDRYWHEAFYHFTWELLGHVKSQVKEQVNEQVKKQVLQINSIKTKITQEKNK